MKTRSLPVLSKPSVTPGSLDFLWSTGIEDTFICQQDARTGRILDEYALTQHYDHWQEDLGLISFLGVSSARYGIPWYRVEPRPGEFDWDWTDRVLDTLIHQYRIEPIIDLMHYGTPEWLEGSFLSRHYPEHVSAYARAFAEHYKGLCYWYTPLNEPRVNAWFAARLGWWPPYRRSWNDFALMLVSLSNGIVRTQHAIAEVESEAVFVHVDATDLYQTADSTLIAEAELRQELVFCALDLVQGRMNQDHPLYGWLLARGVSEAAMDWFHGNAIQPDIIGYNMYPMYSGKHLTRRTNGAITIRNRRCGVETFMKLTRMYAARYGLPVMCTETASDGTAHQRESWIQESSHAVNVLRAEGVPVVGYTYWPLYSLFGWAYQRGRLPKESYLIHMGLWDLEADPTTGWLVRRATSAVEAYRKVVETPIRPLGSGSE